LVGAAPSAGRETTVMQLILIPIPRRSALSQKTKALLRRRTDAPSGVPTRTVREFLPRTTEAAAHERLQKFREARDRIDARLDAWLVEMREHQHAVRPEIREH
jgi:hypothetical protein